MVGADGQMVIIGDGVGLATPSASEPLYTLRTAMSLEHSVAYCNVLGTFRCVLQCPWNIPDIAVRKVYNDPDADVWVPNWLGCWQRMAPQTL
jgi:hypothetical protein